MMTAENSTTHQRFVKTTPKPSATKNNKGDEGPLFPASDCCVALAVAAELAADEGNGCVVLEAIFADLLWKMV
jgi:hypothetical protein